MLPPGVSPGCLSSDYDEELVLNKVSWLLA